MKLLSVDLTSKSIMKNSIKTVVVVFLLAVVLVACSKDNNVTDTSTTKPIVTKSTESDTKQTANTKDFEPTYTEGEDYTVLAKPYDTGVSDKVVVYEFFAYPCPHCFHFEPF